MLGKIKEVVSLIIQTTLPILLLTGIFFLSLHSKDISVYVTPYGEKYHYSDCFYLDDASYLTDYENYIEATKYGYSSCSRCGSHNYDFLTKVKIKITE